MQIKTIVLLITLFISCTVLSLSLHKSNFYKPVVVQKTILINPDGDAHHIGRYIGDSVERSITLHCAQKLKAYIETIEPTLSVLLTRKAGDVVPFLQNAHFANCLHADLFLSLHFYQETDARPHLYIYRYKDSSYFIKPTDQLAFYPYYQAYLINQAQSQQYAHRIFDVLSALPYQKLFTTHSPYAFPAQSLTGIIPPSLMIEMGIGNEHDWSVYIEPLGNALIALLKG